MKVVICSINSKYIHSSLAPWCLAGGLEAYARDVDYKVVEGTINEKIDDVVARILQEKSDLIGFCTYIWNKKFVLTLCEEIKKHSKAKIVLGGPEVSYNPKEILSNSNIDYVLCGEGEESFSQLCLNPEDEKIKGLCYRKENQIIVSEPCVLESEPPSPYVDDYFKQLSGRIAYIETSRGCPYRCAFCLSGRCGGVRFFDLDNSKEKIIKLANSGTKTVKFIDRTFNADRKRANNILEFIIENYEIKIPKGICFHFEIEGELINEEMLEIIKKAPTGLFQFEIGIQSFNEVTLKEINRKANFEKLTANIKSLLALKNCHVHIDLIAGLPYEDFESFEKSFNLAYDLNANMLQFGFLKMLHGSDMRENSEKYQCVYDAEPPYEVASTPWLTKEKLEIMHTCEDVFDRMYNSQRFKRTCKYITDVTKNPFKTFVDFSIYLKDKKTKTLDDFTLELFTYFSEINGISTDKLRDLLVIDRLATNRMGTIPEFLKIHSPLIKQILNELDKNEETRKRKGVKRALSLLSSMKEFVYVDYENMNPVTKEFDVYQKIYNILQFYILF